MTRAVVSPVERDGVRWRPNLYDDLWHFGTSRIEVDGIPSRRGAYSDEIVSEKYDVCCCHLGYGDALCSGDGYRWKPGTPVLRFGGDG